MEKDQLSFRRLVWKLRDAIWAEVAKIPDFENGAIRLLFVPKSNKASGFFGALGTGCEIDLVHPVKEGGSHTRPAGFRGDKDSPETDCSSYAACKIACCAYALKHNLGRRSSDAPNTHGYNPETGRFDGRSNAPGCVVYDIFFVNRFSPVDNPNKPNHYFRLYVSVSGVTGAEDEQCALAAGAALNDWCDNDYDSDGYGHFEKYLSIVGPD